LEIEITNNDIDVDEIITKSNRLGVVINQINDKEERWFELND